MAIAPIAAAAVAPAMPAMPVMPSLPTAAPTGAGGGAFGDMVVGALEQLNGAQKATDDLATSAASGDLVDVHDYMIASTEASLATELTVAVRNKAVEAFTSIMQMPV